MNIPEIKNLVAVGKTAKFVMASNKKLWYTVDGFEFPIPFEDATAIFLAEDRSMFFMRWIRKHIDTIKKAQKDQTDG